eukprot:6479943-Amphidinium_carterae.1
MSAEHAHRCVSHARSLGNLECPLYGSTSMVSLGGGCVVHSSSSHATHLSSYRCIDQCEA